MVTSQDSWAHSCHPSFRCLSESEGLWFSGVKRDRRHMTLFDSLASVLQESYHTKSDEDSGTAFCSLRGECS